MASSQLACFFKMINALVSGKVILERMGKSVKLEGMGDKQTRHKDCISTFLLPSAPFCTFK